MAGLYEMPLSELRDRVGRDEDFESEDEIPLASWKARLRDPPQAQSSTEPNHEFDPNSVNAPSLERYQRSTRNPTTCVSRTAKEHGSASARGILACSRKVLMLMWFVSFRCSRNDPHFAVPGGPALRDALRGVAEAGGAPTTITAVFWVRNLVRSPTRQPGRTV
ncbi:hypothetical protein ANN_13662 [Periplaneta americana]|uniref:Uncharacterized protein n=1 Tax=Periplaneta americana TaxID=6978 RepID=A0ABQ8TMF7_PERAM|nr:hypothetical protein ANN_13662 [Periplaneta americana]